MVNFVFYDIVLLIIFAIFMSVFLYRNKRNLQTEGSLFLYKTQWGVKLIDKLGSRYKKILNFLSYISIGLGYILMGGIIFVIINSVYLYFTTAVSEVVRAPPIAPLIPYFPHLFGMESIFPPFYFIYFIVAIIIVATVHEFSHGIFAKKAGVKIKSTGFAFFKYFPALLGAFVEQDEKQMEKADKFNQMGILSAGVFANVLTAILFYIILFFVFSTTFTATGVVFNTYSYAPVNVSEITSVNGVLVNSFEDIFENIKENNYIVSEEGNYTATKEDLEAQKFNEGMIILYHDAPAIKSNISYIIKNINGIEINNMDKLSKELTKYSPGEKINITTSDGEMDFSQEIVLEKNPSKDSAWLGIGFYENSGEGLIGKVFSMVPSYKQPHVYYEPRNNFSKFIVDFLWWVFIINILVALFNMLPAGIFDGGRFFYLTILGITGSKKIAKKSFRGITMFILFLFLALMVKWVFGFF